MEPVTGGPLCSACLPAWIPSQTGTGYAQGDFSQKGGSDSDRFKGE